MPNQYDNPNNTEIKQLVVRLENELDNLIKMFAWARQALENEMLSGLNPGKHGLHEATTKKLKELTQGMTAMVDSKIRYDKAKRELAKTMTPEEEMSAVVSYVVNLHPDDWQRLKDRIQERGRWKSE